MDHRKLKILFVSSEVEGLSKTGGLADVAKALPIELRNLGHEVKIVTPFYRTIEPSRTSTAPLSFNLKYRLFTSRYSVSQYNNYTLIGIPVLAIDNAHYFDQRRHCTEKIIMLIKIMVNASHSFCLAALQACEAEDFTPDIIHCNDWHTGLIPYLLKTRYQDQLPFCPNKNSIHNT